MIRTHRMRLALVVSAFLVATGVVAGALLLPSYLIVRKNQAALQVIIASSGIPAANAADRDLLKHIQSRVGELGPLVAATSSPSEAIAAALTLRPSGISIDRINYTGGKKPTIVLAGSSRSGDLVNTYQRALAASSRFAGVSVPIGALAGVGDGRFNITLLGAF